MHEYRHFSIRTAQSAKAEFEDFTKIDPNQLLLDCVRSAINLGRLLSLAAEPDQAQECFQKGTLPPAAIPPTGKAPSLLGALPASTEYLAFLTQFKMLMTCNEYLEMYATPVRFTLPSEQVWPVEPFLKY